MTDTLLERSLEDVIIGDRRSWAWSAPPVVRAYMAQGQWIGDRQLLHAADLVVSAVHDVWTGLDSVHRPGTGMLIIWVDPADPDTARRLTVSAYRWLTAQGIADIRLLAADCSLLGVVEHAAEMLAFSHDPEPATVGLAAAPRPTVHRS